MIASSAQAKVVATTTICLVLGLQTLAVLLTKHYGYPFVDYPMFANSFKEGERINLYSIHATLDDGQEMEIRHEDVGLDAHKYYRWAWQIISYDPALQDPGTSVSRATRSGYLARLGRSVGLVPPITDIVRVNSNRYERLNAEELNGRRVVKLRVEDGEVIVTRDGMAPADGPLILREIDLPVGGED